MFSPRPSISIKKFIPLFSIKELIFLSIVKSLVNPDRTREGATGWANESRCLRWCIFPITVPSWSRWNLRNLTGRWRFLACGRWKNRVFRASFPAGNTCPTTLIFWFVAYSNCAESRHTVQVLYVLSVYLKWFYDRYLSRRMARKNYR